MPTPSESHTGGFELGETRGLIVPVALVTCLALRYGAHWPWLAVGVIGALLCGVYFYAPRWAATSMQRFDHDAVSLLSAGKPNALAARYAIALGMRWFAPRHAAAERQAMVLAETGDMRRAQQAFGAALRGYGPAAPLRVVLGYAHASFALGQDELAIATYRRLLVSAGSLPGVERSLAHALVRRGEDLPEALAMLERAEREARNTTRIHEVKLVQALAHAKLGNHEQARQLREETTQTNSDSLIPLRKALETELDR